MGNSYFDFKKFSIKQDDTAMKVGVDSVILGSWANIDIGDKILDIGTGTGILALMSAQRNVKAAIDAVEIDESAWSQACENVKKSPFSKRIECHHSSIQEYGSLHHLRGVYDHIISNPPYFDEDTHSKDKSRNRARHTTDLTFHEIFEMSSWLLKPDGNLTLVFPYSQWRDIEYWSWSNRLYASRRLTIIHRVGKEPKRMCAEFSLKKLIRKDSELIIEDTTTGYTSAYIDLTKEFYLKF